jgi:aminoglycoside 6'-N-acetyltransferase
MVGLASLAGDHMDIDILIGEDAYLGRGVGPVALQLIVDLLASQGVSSTGLGTDPENARACRAFRKAGFQQRAEFQEAQRSLLYFTRDLGAAVE